MSGHRTSAMGTKGVWITCPSYFTDKEYYGVIKCTKCHRVIEDWETDIEDEVFPDGTLMGFHHKKCQY